jgi:hypothetical protein
MKSSEGRRYQPCNREQQTGDLSNNFHPTPYVMSARELWTGLVIFFMIGVSIGAFAFALISSFHQ